MRSIRNIAQLFLISMICLLCTNSFAQQANKEIKPDLYRAVHWTIEDGLTQANSGCMLKDVKGFLWIGTGYGLNRFDGSRFKNYFAGSHNKATISDGGLSDRGVQPFGNLIMALKEDSLHNIWIGTDAGLQRYDIKADTFTHFLPSVDSTDSGIIPFQATKDEMYCIDVYSRIVVYNIHSFTKKFLVDLPADLVGHRRSLAYTIFDPESNSIWLLDDCSALYSGGLVQISLSTGKINRYAWKCFKNIPHHCHLSESMRDDPKRNCIWINSNDGLVQFTLGDKKFHRVDAIDKLPSIKGYDKGSVQWHWVGIDMDTRGRVWSAIVEKGIIVYDPSAQTAFQPVEDNDNTGNEISDKNFALYCDGDGIVWTGYWANKGIYELLPYSQSVRRYTSDTTKPFSLSSNHVISFAPADHGRVWIGTNDGINIFEPQKESFEALHEKDLPGVSVRNGLDVKLVDTLAHKAFIQDYNGLFQMDTRTRKCTRVIFKDSTNKIILPEFFFPQRPFKNSLIVPVNYGNNFGIFIVNSDSIVAHEILRFPKIDEPYVLNDGHNIYLKSTQEKYNFTYTNQNGRWIQISSGFDTIQGNRFFFNDADRSYWVFGNKQLIHFDKTFKIIHAYTSKEGLPNLYIYGWITDKYGNCWFNTDRSIFRVDIKTGIIYELRDKDGFQKQNVGVYPGVARDNNGDLYFAAAFDGQGFDRIDPDKFRISYPPATVYLQSLEVSQKPFTGSTGVNNLQNLSLKYFENKITIETGIIDYYSKGQSRIRYKLEARGENADWQYAPDYYTIRYENLQPGRYTLIMQAGNVANEFNGPEKILMIHINPPFWETWWFRTLAFVFLLLIFYAIYRWRTATLRRQKRKLEQTVTERTAEVVEEKAVVERQKDVIQKEKEKSDELLLNILPSEVAEELKEKGYTTAKAFDEVTVLFSDIKGFTHVAEKLTAQELVKEINTYFSAFDNIMKQFGLEKIKTIGDAYIAAGGLPEGNQAAPKNVVEAAIAMQQVVENLKQERVANGSPYFELRIGIHTGPVVAGVVGIKKFQYDIWGDTVNLSARMEQSGVPGKINISQQTYELVKEQFTCIHRGRIEAKNKGEIDMYFVE